MMQPDLLHLCKVAERHFINTAHKNILIAMRTLQKDGLDIIISAIAQRANVDMDYLYEVASFVITPSQRETHWHFILEAYNKREILRKCNLVIGMCEKSHEIKDIMIKATEILDTDAEYKGKTLFPGVFDTFERIFSKGESVMLSDTTCYPRLDTFLGGRRSGSVYILGARPSVGKSTMMLNFCLNSKLQSCIFSTESPAHEIHIRMMSNIARVESWKIEKGIKDIEDVVSEKVVEVGAKLGTCNIYDDFLFEDMEVIIAKEAASGTKLVFIDYLQQIRSNQKQETVNNYIGKITGMLKNMAIKYGLAIIVLAQLNRKVGEGEPGLEHLRDSGNIEQDADVVMFLHDNPNEMIPNRIELIIAKNRHGTKGTINLKFERMFFCISNLP